MTAPAPNTPAPGSPITAEPPRRVRGDGSAEAPAIQARKDDPGSGGT